MCTIALAWRVLDDAPVAVAANRDEALERESVPPRLLDADPAVVAPQDVEAGGTWLGVSERGLVVVIANRRIDGTDGADEDGNLGNEDGNRDDEDGTRGDVDGNRSDERRSRGLLVRDALGRADARDALEFVRETVTEHAYDGFNLLVVDSERAVSLEWDGRLRERELEPGVHVIVNSGLNEADERAVRLRDALAVEDRNRPAGAEDRPNEASAWLSRAAALLGDHDYGSCVHGDGFGTRSSSLLRVSAAGSAGDDVTARAAYAFADGPPCETDYEPVGADASFLEGSF